MRIVSIYFFGPRQIALLLNSIQKADENQMFSESRKKLLCWAVIIAGLHAETIQANENALIQDHLMQDHLLQDDRDLANNNPWIIQYQFGFASDADFGPSLLFLVDESQERTRLHSLSFGRQLSDTFYGRDLDVSAHVSIQYFVERGFQNDIIGTTGYWRLARHTYLPYTRIPIKLSLAQGLSYVSDIPVAEVRDFAPEKSAKLTHYLEFGLHYSFKSRLAKNDSLLSYWFEDINLGYTIFHRSSVFGLFADKGGGINFPGIAIEFILK